MEISIQPELSRFLEGPVGRKGEVWESCFCCVFPAMKAVTEFNINHRVTLREPTLCQCEAIPPGHSHRSPQTCVQSPSGSFGALLGTGRAVSSPGSLQASLHCALVLCGPVLAGSGDKSRFGTSSPAHCGHPTSICPCPECLVQEVHGLQSFLMFPAMNYSPRRN